MTEHKKTTMESEISREPQFFPFQYHALKEHPEENIPEILSGFDPLLPSVTDAYHLESFYAEAQAPAVYQLQITITALRDIPRMFIFAGRKSMIFRDGLTAGETKTISAYVHTGDIIPRYHTDVYTMNKLFVSFAWEKSACVPDAAPACGSDSSCAPNAGSSCSPARLADILSFRIQMHPASAPVIYLAGDSTVTDQSSELPYHPGACYSSWGQDLPLFTGKDCPVDNQAHCGLSTETFRQEGHMDIILREIKPGDYCLFQFGHNDQKLSYLQAETGYRDNLIRFIGEIREKQAVPVLVTPLGRNTWAEDGTYLDLLKEHSDSVKRIGRELSVPVLDLHDYSLTIYAQYGFEGSKRFFHPGDATHTNEYGSELYAAFIARALHACFPDLIPGAADACACLCPEENLWEQLRSQGSGGRNLTAEQKEQFDGLEKSVGDLLQRVQAAKADAARK
ncbi:MAG: rhamnogalacturonan acetylesterase [Lachnospiraceae bacterium]|nr:rhamnogalacturonan acetylesterase [Lachnospiraceae bacterium]